MKKGFLLVLLLALAQSVLAQNTPGLTAAESKKAEAYYHFSLARMLDQQEQWNKSIEEYQRALTLTPNDSVIYSAMARTYLNHGKKDEAIQAAEKAIQIDANNIGAHRMLAEDVYIQMLSPRGQNPSPAVVNTAVDKAIHEYEEIIRIDQSNRRDFMLLGKLYEMDGTPDKAADLYKKFLGIEPGSEEGVTELAKLYLQSNKTADAIELLQTFLKSQPDSAVALEMLGDAYSELGDSERAVEVLKHAAELNDDPDLKEKYAVALFQDNRMAEAARIYEEILKDDVRNVEVMVRLGEIYRRLMKYSEARAVLNRALTLDRANNVIIRFRLVLVDRDEGKFEDAIKSLAAILKETEKTNYNASERQNRGLFLTHVGLLNSLLIRYDQAIQAFTDVRALSLGPDKVRADALIIDTYKAAKNLDRALQHVETAMKEFPDNRDLQMSYADIIAERGRADEGIQTLQKLSKDGEPDLELLSAMAGIYERAKRFSDAQAILDTAAKRFPKEKEVYFLQGALFERQKKFTEAEQAFRKALDFDKNNPSALNYLGYMLAERGVKLEEALQMIQKAVDSDPINGAFLDSLGWVYFKMDQLDLAEQYLKRAVIFAANNATMYDHLGDVYYKKGQFQDAQTQWTKGLQYADDPEEAGQIKQKLEQVRTRIANK